MSSKRSQRGSYAKTYLKIRRDGAQYHRGVPTLLRPIVGRDSWVRWLGNWRTLTTTDATMKARELATEHDKLIVALLALSDDERTRIIKAGGLEAWTAGNVDRWRQGGEAHIELFVAETAALMAPDPDTSEGDQGAAALAALRGRAAAQQIHADFAEVQTTAQKLVEGPTESAFNLQPIFDLWAPRSRVPKVHDQMRSTIAEFVKGVGDLTAQQITRAHAVKFRDYVLTLKDKNGAPLTVMPRYHVARMNTLLSVAQDHNIIDANPFHRVTVQKTAAQKFAELEDDSERPFSPENLKHILANIGSLSPDDAMVMRLMIYSGARSGEICQLRACDVLKVDGVDAIKICAEAPKASLKNKFSRRTIPLHEAVRPDVVARASHVAATKGAEAFLFEYPFWRASNNYAGKFQKQTGRWLRKIGITDPELTPHSARHSFTDACRRVAMPEYIINQLTGRRLGKGSVGDYGKGVGMRDLAKWVRKVNPLKG